jgi:predicted RNase H-like HicB family nuclease
MKYLIEVFWSEEDQAYAALVRDLPGCRRLARPPKEAVHEVADATLAWIEACRAAGEPRPEPNAKARQDAAGRNSAIASHEWQLGTVSTHNA